MSSKKILNLTNLHDVVQPLVVAHDFIGIAEVISVASTEQLTVLLKRLPNNQRAIVFRLLPKGQAVEVFERISPGLQSDLIAGLQDGEVATIFRDLDPDDRVWLLDELPASLAPRLLQGLTEEERQLTAHVLGYPRGSVGRRMSPEYVSVRHDHTVDQALQRVYAKLDRAETVYVLPVVDESRRVVGVVGLRDLLLADANSEIRAVMSPADVCIAKRSAESAARTCADLGVLALPIVDNENRLVGLLTIDDAVRILEHEETEDAARQGGVEPLRRPYLATPLRTLVSSRIVWLLVLGIGAALTVKVLSIFEATLAQVTVLALFVPLLIGTGGNTGNQAATTVTRALALGDVERRDLWRVLRRELGVGSVLGACLGLIGGLVTALIFEPRIGLVIGLALVAVCAMAAMIGGVMPIIARILRVDPAVFSNPFITTFVDATGLVLYFLVAKAVLGV